MPQVDKAKRLGAVKFRGDVRRPEDVSAVAVVGDLLVIGTDEGNAVQVLRPDGGRHYRVTAEVPLNPTGDEVDVEGIACDGRTVYVLGSHACVRPNLSDDDAYAENRRRIATSDRQDGRDRLFRFALDADGQPGPVEQTSLRPFIDKDPVLRTFARVPSKENGIDAEGVAVHDGRLFVGFRGPVLRGNHVPVLTCTFAATIRDAALRFVNLGGRGFRDLVRVKKGFLILAGPVGDGPGSFRLYFWDGGDCLPGARADGDEPAGRVELLCKVPAEAGEKPEGLAVLDESKAAYELLVVYDGAKDGGATRFRVRRP